MVKIIHIIPHDGIGGVESAARSMLEGSLSKCDFTLLLIAGKSFTGNKDRVIESKLLSENNPFAHLQALKKICSSQPDILVCSLWRSIPVGLAAKLLKPKTKLVFFLHSPSTIHWVDKLLSRLMLTFCDAAWSDSQTTLSSRLPTKRKIVQRVISFVTSKNPADLQQNPVTPHFVFWGRLHHHKGLDRSLTFIQMLIERGCAASYEIWGPDGGEQDFLINQIKRAGMSDVVSINGPVHQNELNTIAEQNTFYLQLSRLEGMAMSVVEAMQRSLVPIVTPVGEISEYCQQDKNAIIVNDPDNPVKAVNELLALLQDEARYRQLQTAASRQWSQCLLYKDDFCKAAQELFTESPNPTLTSHYLP